LAENPEVATIANFKTDELYRAVGQLSERQRTVIQMRFGLEPYSEPLTLQEVARQFGVTSERVRQLEHKALLRLRGTNLRRVLLDD
jgi:RNA polymerase sigma factor (sigma-70 family)